MTRILCFLIVSALLFVSHTQAQNDEALVTATPSFIDTIENITVSWKGVSTPRADDIIAVFGPATVTKSVLNLTTIAVKNAAPSTWHSGAGSAKFELLNMRQDYVFRYMRKSGREYVVIAESNIVAVKACKPMGEHISYTSNPTEMRVMWVSNCDNSSVPMVLYGESPTNLTKKVSATTTTYEMDDLCWKSKGGEWSQQFWWDPGMIHNAVMTDLKPRTKYYYRFGTANGWSDVKSFFSWQTDNKAELNIVAFGDSGVAECEGMYGWCEPASGMTTNLIAQEMQTTNFDLLLHIGDIAYAVGHGVRWDQFFHQIEPIAASLPYHVCIGNHEFDYIGQEFMPDWADYGEDSHGECGVPFNKRFQMPTNGNGNLWWSIDYASIHFVLISTEHDFTIGSVQYQWLENDLKGVNRTTTPWIILSGHRPMYTSRNYKPELLFAEKMRENLEHLLVKYDVDVALWGHIHNYERSCPVINGTCKGDLNNPQGTIHFVIGMGGQTFFFDWTDPQPEWSMFRAAQYGYITIHVPENDHHRMLIEYKGDKDASVHDTVWIQKQH